MTDDPEAKTPLDQALDVFVFLPVGFLVEFPRSVPRFIESGRRQLGAVKRIGRESVGVTSIDPARQLDRLREQTRNTLRGLGVVPTEDNGRSPFTAVPSRIVDPARLRVTRTAAPDTPVDRDEPGIDPATLAIPDYDSLSASQVVPRLASLNPDELDTVRLYELAKRGRKTILGKIAQLQAG